MACKRSGVRLSYAPPLFLGVKFTQSLRCLHVELNLANRAGKCNECAADIIHLSFVLDMIFHLQKSRQLILQL